MVGKSSNQLVPVPKMKPPAVSKNKSLSKPFDLVSGNIHFENREDVRSLLPDILGKVLARIWIDSDFHRTFSIDPQGTLEKNGVFLPNTMTIEFQKPESDRPRDQQG